MDWRKLRTGVPSSGKLEHPCLILRPRYKRGRCEAQHLVGQYKTVDAHGRPLTPTNCELIFALTNVTTTEQTRQRNGSETFTMNPMHLPAAVASAIASGDLTRLKDLYQPNMALEGIARHAAQHRQPQILQWCYDQGWSPPQKSLNSAFFTSAVTGKSPAIFQILIDHGFDLNAHENEAHGDALACAVMCGDYELASSSRLKLLPLGMYYKHLQIP